MSPLALLVGALLFVAPASDVATDVEPSSEHGEERPFIGVSMGPPAEDGTPITEIVPDSPAEQYGLLRAVLAGQTEGGQNDGLHDRDHAEHDGLRSYVCADRQADSPLPAIERKLLDDVANRVERPKLGDTEDHGEHHERRPRTQAEQRRIEFPELAFRKRNEQEHPEDHGQAEP